VTQTWLLPVAGIVAARNWGYLGDCLDFYRGRGGWDQWMRGHALRATLKLSGHTNRLANGVPNWGE
jgi:hypothetical protein